jgi:hypothetical protein
MPLHRHCGENGIPHAAYDDFFDILRFFTAARPGPAQPGKKQERIERRRCA